MDLASLHVEAIPQNECPQRNANNKLENLLAMVGSNRQLLLS